MGKFNGKVVIVTGSSAGIGQASAVDFGKEGAFVVIHGQDAGRLKATEGMLHDVGVKPDHILSIMGSMEDESTPSKIINETIKRFGKIDILVNNAGAGKKPNVQDVFSLENMDYLYKVNFRAVVELTQLAAPHLIKTKGNIVNVSSVASVKTYPAFALYGSLKAALDHYTRNMAQLYGSKGVRVNAVNPGAIKTFIMERNGVVGDSQKQHYEWASLKTAMHRVGESPEIASVIRFLASDDASYVTGVTLLADGGYAVHAQERDVFNAGEKK